VSDDRTLRSRVLKRAPLRDDLALTLSTDGLYAPVKRRAAFCYCDVPALALTAGGFVYYPPSSGAVVRACGVNGDNGAPSTWRFGLGVIADIALSSQAGTPVIRPVWPDAPLAGQFEQFQFNGIGDLSGALAAGTIAYPNVPVMPGNIFIAALTGDALIAEGFLFVEEFLNGNEEL